MLTPSVVQTIWICDRLNPNSALPDRNMSPMCRQSFLKEMTDKPVFLNDFSKYIFRVKDMCRDMFRTVLDILLSSTLIANIVTTYQENSRRKKQNKYQDAKANLPILIEILEDLNILEQAYLFRGVFCPPLEHRAPHLSDKDGDGVTNMSYAQRGRQFSLIGYRIIRNCKKVIFLTPVNHLPGVLEICKDIKNFLCSKTSRDSKTHLDKHITLLVGILPQNSTDREEEIKVFTEKLHQFYVSLDAAIERELPFLSE